MYLLTYPPCPFPVSFCRKPLGFIEEDALADVGEVCARIDVDKKNSLKPAFTMEKNFFYAASSALNTGGISNNRNLFANPSPASSWWEFLMPRQAFCSQYPPRSDVEQFYHTLHLTSSLLLKFWIYGTRTISPKSRKNGTAISYN